MQDLPPIPQTPEPSAPRESPPSIPVIFTEDPGDAAAEKERQAAFDAVFRWKGRVLHGFTSARRNLFYQLRTALGAPKLSMAMADGHAFVADAVRIIFLCWHRPDEVPEQPGVFEGWETLRSDPAALQRVIDAWCDVHVPAADEMAASGLAMDIWLASQANRHEAAPGPRVGSDLVGN